MTILQRCAISMPLCIAAFFLFSFFIELKTVDSGMNKQSEPTRPRGMIFRVARGDRDISFVDGGRGQVSTETGLFAVDVYSPERALAFGILMPIAMLSAGAYVALRRK